MRIIRIELFRYLAFKFSGIERLEIDLVSNIQNIIGSNGSGKTSLLKELNPRPAIRTDYGDCGYKKITIFHNNNEYVLMSDFSNLSSPHSFIKDNEELNSSGTTSVQEELIIFHLGYTSQVHNICYGYFPLSRMNVGTRKTYLLTAHPCQMKLILDYHKKVNQALRACRDNLSMLHERRASLASQLIEDSVKLELIEENNKLTNELGSIVEASHRLINQKTNLQKTLNNTSLPLNVKSLKDIILQRPRYATYKSIPRHIPIDICLNQTKNQIEILVTKQTNLVSRARELTLEIDKYEKHIKENDAKGALELVEASISTLIESIQTLEKYPVETPFDNYVLEKIPEHINYLTDLVSFFIGYNAPIPSLKDVSRLKEKLYTTKTKKIRIDQEEHILQERLVKYQKILNETLIENIPKSCKGCILFQKYHQAVFSAQSDYNDIRLELDLIQLKQKRYQMILEGRSETLSLYEMAVPRLQKLSDHFSENRYLLIPLQGIDILQTLRRNPSALIVKIQNHFNLSLGYYELKKKRDSLDKLILEQTNLKKPSEFGQKFLEQMVIEKHHELSIIRDEHNQHEISRLKTIDFLNLLISYEKDLIEINKDYEDLKTMNIYRTLEHEISLCDLYINHLQSIKHQVVDRLTDIDRILKEQDSILSRYRDEVMMTIEKITIQEQEYVELEKALSPTTGIAHKYMIQFLNDLFHDANIFMSEVFSYPFEFVLLEEDSILDYKFKMKVGDLFIPEVSEGSEAQMEMANFAFNLALSIQKEQSHYGLMLDECGRTFDSYHKQKLVEFLKMVVEDGLISQLFLINHHATISAGLLNSNTIVLNDLNIVIPEIYNEHVIIEKYE